MPGPQFNLVESVVEAEQTNAMFNAAETLSRCAAHPLGGTVCTAKRWIRLLEFQKFAVEAVVDRVFKNRFVEHVISVGRPVEQTPKLGSPLVAIRH